MVVTDREVHESRSVPDGTRGTPGSGAIARLNSSLPFPGDAIGCDVGFGRRLGRLGAEGGATAGDGDGCERRRQVRGRRRCWPGPPPHAANHRTIATPPTKSATHRPPHKMQVNPAPGSRPPGHDVRAILAHSWPRERGSAAGLAGLSRSHVKAGRQRRLSRPLPRHRTSTFTQPSPRSSSAAGRDREGHLLRLARRSVTRSALEPRTGRDAEPPAGMAVRPVAGARAGDF